MVGLRVRASCLCWHLFHGLVNRLEACDQRRPRTLVQTGRLGACDHKRPNATRGFSVVLSARAIGIDLLDAAAGECGKLFHDCAVDQDAETPATHCAMLQWPPIDHDLSRLICRGLDRSGKRHLIARPGRVEVGHILDSEGDSDECVRTLQSHPVDGIMNGIAEEVGLVSRMWGLSAPRCQCIRQCQRPAKSAAVTVTTLAGHVSTVVDTAVVDTAALPTIERAPGVASGR